MGRFNPYQLTDWHRDHGAALVDLNRSLPIGRQRRISTVEATQVYVDDKCIVVYGNEVEMDSIQGCPLELPKEVEEMFSVKRLTGWLMYTKNKMYKGHDLVATEIPPRNLYFQGRLQAPLHRKKSEIVEKFRQAIEKTGFTDPIHAISMGLSSVSFQPFESRSDVISAWLIEPQRIHEFAITQRPRNNELEPGEIIDSPLWGNFKIEKAEWSLGICQDIDRCIGLLDVDEQKANLFRQTENGELFKNYPVGKENRPRGLGPICRPVTAIAASFHEYVYRSAVMTALAGIDESIYLDTPRADPKPVIRQVKVLYHRFMYELVQRCDPKPPGVGTVELKADKMSSPEFIQTERGKQEANRDKVLPLGPEVFIAGMEMAVAKADNPDETLVRLIIAAPEEWPLSKKLVAWLSKYRSEFSEAIQALVDERLRVQGKN